MSRYLGETPNWTLRVGDAFAGLVERGVDRMVIDLAEPWRLLDEVAAALRPGGVVTGFIPTALQVKQLVDELRAHGGFGAVRRSSRSHGWHVRERSPAPPTAWSSTRLLVFGAGSHRTRPIEGAPEPFRTLLGAMQ